MIYKGDNVTKNYSLPFQYISKEHVKAYINGTETSYTWVNAGTVTFTQAPATNALISILRITPRDTRLVDFNDGAILSERELDLSSLQLLYLIQEAIDITGDVISYNPLENLFNAEGKRISNVGDPQDDQDALTLGYYKEHVLPQLKADINEYFREFTGPLLQSYEQYKIMFEGYITHIETMMNTLNEINTDVLQTLNNATEDLQAELRVLVEQTQAHVKKAITSSLEAKNAKETTELLVNNIKELQHKGQWQDGGIYKPQNIVEMGGSSYVLKTGDGLYPPPHPTWTLVARSGVDSYGETLDGGHANSTYQATFDCGGA